MFSQLGSIFKTQFRRTESNDTRQYIPHEERDKNRKKDEEPPQKTSDESAWTDDASVSVLALRAFLIDFLKTLSGSEAYSPINKKDIPARPKEKKRPTNTYNAKAVRAYQTMATHAQQDPEKNTESDNKEPDKLASQEIRDIHNLIINLETLEKNGVSMLGILKASSFVEGLKQAVEQKLQNLKT